MRVVEIFTSIEGEGIRAGEISTFVRLAGCNLRCSYCDTQYALSKNSGQEMSVMDILRTAIETRSQNVTITGGEPLIQKDTYTLVDAFLEQGFLVNIETNGSIDISPYLRKDGCFLTVDYKMPSSGYESSMKKENFTNLRSCDVIKCVVEESDLDSVKKVLELNKNRAYVYLSPVFSRIKPEIIVERMKEMLASKINMDRVRIQVQLHKIIWSPDKRGV